MDCASITKVKIIMKCVHLKTERKQKCPRVDTPSHVAHSLSVFPPERLLTGVMRLVHVFDLNITSRIYSLIQDFLSRVQVYSQVGGGT